ncbi:hypothetical protein [Flagellimonas sp. CMM7]|uniref:hypothetical protein n=1 Tax=Flagellimonas sp. CMM7 TaxID=2654676 RepID=UPI001F479CF0|nr:hypothetical protein [Flagellimonas sp. CMM7]UII80637.1 hypothetical protein LV704_03770 [Flagellimonas sp. CMM7]
MKKSLKQVNYPKIISILTGILLLAAISCSKDENTTEDLSSTEVISSTELQFSDEAEMISEEVTTIA